MESLVYSLQHGPAQKGGKGTARREGENKAERQQRGGRRSAAVVVLVAAARAVVRRDKQHPPVKVHPPVPGAGVSARRAEEKEDERAGDDALEELLDVVLELAHRLRVE